jgi:hypothetical protein
MAVSDFSLALIGLIVAVVCGAIAWGLWRGLGRPKFWQPEHWLSTRGSSSEQRERRSPLL